MCSAEKLACLNLPVYPMTAIFRLALPSQMHHTIFNTKHNVGVIVCINW